MKELTKEEISAFEGLNESYVDMYDKLVKTAPTCHMVKMFFDECEGDTWWECNYCGHTKSID